MKKGFTLLEIVFVIIIIGILITIASTKLVGTREDATIISLKAQYRSIQDGLRINLRKQFLKGIITGIPSLEKAGSSNLFAEVVRNGIKGNIDTSKLVSGWNKINDHEYKACITGKNCVLFTYTPGVVTTSSTTASTAHNPSINSSFTCDETLQLCQRITAKTYISNKSGS